MTVAIDITVEDIAAALEDYESIQLERATSATGTFSLITTLTLEDGVYAYSYEDANGDLNKWYRYRFYNSTGPAAGPYSNVFQPDGGTRLKARQLYMQTYDAGMVFEATSGGSSTSVPTTDYHVKTSHRDGRGKNTWLHPVSGSRSYETRNISDSNPSTGTFTVNPAMSGAVASGDSIEWHWLSDPDAVNAAINRGLARYYFLDSVPILGDGSGEYDLTDLLPWLESKDRVTGVWWFPPGSAVDYPWASDGKWYRIDQDAGRIVLHVYPAIEDTVTLYVEAVRVMPLLFTDDAVLPDKCDLQLVAALTYDEVLARLSRPSSAPAKDRDAWAQERVRHAGQELAALFRKNRVSPRRGPVQHPDPPARGQPFTAR